MKPERFFSNEVARININEPATGIFPYAQFKITVKSQDGNLPRVHIESEGWHLTFPIGSALLDDILSRGSNDEVFGYIIDSYPLWLDQPSALQPAITNLQNARATWEMLRPMSPHSFEKALPVLFLVEKGLTDAGDLARDLKKLVPNCQVLSPQLTINPDDDLPLIASLCQEHSPMLVIGIGLGAVYAVKMHDYRRICINPSTLFIPRVFMNARSLDELETHLFDNLSGESRQRCWTFFINKLPYSFMRDTFVSHAFPHVIDIPSDGLDAAAAISDSVLPYVVQLLTGVTP